MTNKTDPCSPYWPIARFLHLIMIALCVVASFAIYIIDSLLCKILLAILLLAYAYFLLKNSQIAALLFRIARNQPRSEYAKVRQWSDASTSQESQGSGHEKGASVVSKKGSLNTTNKEEVSVGSLERSLLRDESFSSFRGMSTSYLNDSHLTTSRRRVGEQRGLDLLEHSIFTQSSQSRSVGRSSAASEKSFQILDRKAIARKRLHGYKSESEKGYEQQLQEIKRSAKYVQSKYQAILNSIHALINPIINEHRNNSAKLQELSLQFLDVVVDQKYKQIENITNSGRKLTTQTLRISMQGLIERYLEAHARKEPLEYSKLPLRPNKKWNDLEKKISELMRARMRLAESMGVPTEGLGSQVRPGVGPFVEQYNTYIGMIEGFIASDITRKNYQASLEELNDESLVKQFKNRIYILYLYVKHLNSLLRGCVKIDLKDYIGLRQLVTEGELEIIPKYSFDAYVPYYNLYASEQGVKKCYPCEYGTANYLSLIYFLLLCLSRRPEVRERPEVVRIINDIL